MRKKIYFIFIYITAMSCLAPAQEPVHFADANLKAVVEETLGITDPTPTDMLGLTELYAHDREISNLTGLEHATNLQTLGLHRNKISDISLLSPLTNLQELYLSENHIGDISLLSGFTNLQDLNLSCNPINDISPLAGLTNLKWLGAQSNQINDILPLSGLTRLQSLCLGGNQISDISPLSNLTNLLLLWLQHNQISDISPLSILTSLETLNLDDNQITDISPIFGLTSLQDLNLSQNQISDFSPISGLVNLERLRLSDTQISDTTFLSDLIDLQDLWLGSNQIRDVLPLSRLTSLQVLYIGYNHIRDLSPLSELTNLQSLYLWNNPLNADAYTIHIPLFESYGTTVQYSPPVWRTLEISSTAGGSVVEPGEGDFDYTNLTVVDVNAVAMPGYEFANWTGSAVDAGNVADLAAVGTTVTMEANYTLRANFSRIPICLYVDDDAPNDPGAGNPQISDTNEDGSPEHPFDTIQEAIDAAENRDTVLVCPGLYQEEINFLGKAIKVQGVATSTSIPILENPDDFAVSFYSGEDLNSILKNFIIRDSFMGIFIAGCSPTISNLTIVNNKYGIEAYAGSEPDISNCILWNNSDDDLFQCRACYSCIERTSEGEGNISFDPLFVDPNNGDYHLCSERGRYWPEHDIWVLDKVTSPCIDAGDPNADYSNEPTPNGDRINMGAYGGTAYASMSDSPLIGDLLPPEVVEQVFGITGGFHFNSSWFIAKFYNGSEYTITRITINVRLTDRITGQQQWYEVVLGPLGAIILPGQTAILSADVGVTNDGKDFYWEIIDMTGYHVY
ncbi:MAG: leucine-rich repeat domain-containing protein [Planctomycetota bacterium]